MEVPYKPIQDAPTPSGNGVAALFLQDLATVTGEARWAQRAEEVLRTFAQPARAHGYFAATYFLALSRLLQPPAHVVVCGPWGDPQTQALHRAAWHSARPDRLVSWVDPGQPLPEPARAMAARGGQMPTAFVCVGAFCTPPQTDPEELRQVLNGP